MKTIAKNYKLTTNGKKLHISLVALFRAVGIGGEIGGGEVPGEVLDTLRLELVSPGVTGAVVLTTDTSKPCHYLLDGSMLEVSLAGLVGGVHRLTVLVKYGTNTYSLLISDLEAPANVLYLVAGEVVMPLMRMAEKDGTLDGVKYYAFAYSFGEKLAWLRDERPQHVRGTVEAYYADNLEATLEDATELEGARLVLNKPGQMVYDGIEDIQLAPVDTFGGAGGDYKTDVYMDGDGRVMVERGEDGSTMILDEHENPILKRNADGSTQYFDAYQSARLLIDAHGKVSLNYTEDETVKILQLAEAILARTSKHLLYNTAGETTIKDEEGNVLTHAQIYAMLMSTPDFVVLVRSDHAFHPNLVTPTQIAFTCSYLGTDGHISAERVNITDANVVTYTSGKGIATASNGALKLGYASATGLYSFSHGGAGMASGESSHVEGDGTGIGQHYASGKASHAEGYNTSCTGRFSHAEGNVSVAIGQTSHAEGNFCKTNAGTSHAEGNYCETGTNGGSAHAEGSYTNANGSSSHAEGYRTVTTEGGQHAQGCWNKSEGGQFSFMHGFGTDADNRANAFLIAGAEVYMYGIGGYDGTNYGTEGVKSVQTVIRELQLKLVNF